MNISEVVKKFSVMSGLLGESVHPWINICEDSILEIRSRLRENVSEEDNKEKLNSAAAALSFYKYVLCASTKNDIDPENQYISNPYTKNLALSMWKEYQDGISSLLKDNNFVFKIV